jgi:hypothetical protein
MCGFNTRRAQPSLFTGVEVHRDIGMARTATPNDLMWERVNTAMLQIQADKAWDTATGSSA